MVLFLNANISAIEYKKVALKYCNYSFNDPDFNIWDVTTQTGVFLEIRNVNMVTYLNDADSKTYYDTGKYSYRNYQPLRGYYTNFGTYNPTGLWPYNTTSRLPFLNLKPSGNKIYLKCVYSSLFRIMIIEDYEFDAQPGGGGGVYASFDFNLTEDYIRNSPKYFKSTNIYSSDPLNPVLSPMSYYTSPNGNPLLVGTVSSSNTYFDNEYNPDHSQSVIYSDGFWPDTEPVIISEVNLDSLKSGLLQSASYLRENGRVEVISPRRINYFYINSTISPGEGDLMPFFNFSQKSFENLNTKIVNIPTLYNAGEQTEINYTVYNDFNKPLSNIGFEYAVSTDTYWSKGIGTIPASENGVDKVDYFSSLPLMNFLPLEIKNFSFRYTIPNNAIFPILRSFAGIRKSSVRAPAYDIIGYDNIGYLGFDSYDPRIEFDPALNKAIFKIYMNLYVSSSNPAVTVYPNEYNISFQVFKLGTPPLNILFVAENFSITLDDNEFNNVIRRPNLSRNEPIPYFFKTVLNPDKYNESGNYQVSVTSVKLTEPYKNRYIGRILTVPKFDSGNLSYYDGSNQFELAKNKRNDIKSFTIFNPTFFFRDFNISLTNFPTENYTITYIENFSIGPIKSRKIYLTINATHAIWPINNETRSFFVNVQMTDDLGNSISERLFFEIKTFEGNVSVLDLRAKELRDDIPDTGSCLLYAGWLLDIDNDSMNINRDKIFNVTLKIKDMSGNTLSSWYEPRSIGVNNFVLTHQFNGLDRYNNDYEAVLELDPENNIAEINISKDPAKYNNNLSIVLSKTSRPRTCSIDSDCTMLISDNTCNAAPVPPRACSCYWNSINNPYNSGGDFCRACSNIINIQLYCAGYINKKTCEADPCSAALRLCKSRKGGDANCGSAVCEWLNGECVFKMDLSETKKCFYRLVDKQTCEQGYNFWIKEHQLIPPPTSDLTCSPSLSQIKGKCQIMLLPFFNKYNIITAVILLVSVYFIVLKKKK